MATQDVRFFDGVNDNVLTDVGIMGSQVGATTVLAVIKLSSITNLVSRTIVGFGSSGTESFRMGFNGSNVFIARVAGTDRTVAAITLAEADGYAIVGFSRAAGTTTPRGHFKLLSGGSWVHSNSSGSNADPTAATVSNRMGESQDSTRDCAMWLALLGVFNADLADVDIEALTSALLWKNHANCTLLWRPGDATVNDLVGSAHQSAVNGTSVVSDLDDAAFNLSTTAPPASGNNTGGQFGQRVYTKDGMSSVGSIH